MSHNTHVFLSSEITAQACMSWINSSLDDSEIFANGVDSHRIIGAVNLTTGKFTPELYEILGCIDEPITDYPITIEKLEEYANDLFSQDQWDYLKKQLNLHIKNQMYWNAAKVCEQLDGIKGAIHAQKRWTVKDPFPINNGYFRLPGITDWFVTWDYNANIGKAPDLYAIIVDFHR